ncbi:sensor histidine kinase [Nostocoides vanveenii]|uniref:histidine kinase n=1 Tax=Nostocoides vanveenii TaxID=330835 RepID=A0ABN2KRL3_9MICO
MTIPRDPPNPPLGRWGKTWRVAFVVIVGFLAWVTVRSTLPDDISPALRLWAMLGDLLAGIAAGVLTIWRRRWPLRIALIVTLAGALSTSAGGAVILVLASVAARRRWRELAWLIPLNIATGVVTERIYPSLDENRLNLILTLIMITLLVAAVTAIGYAVGGRRELERERVESAQRDQERRVAQAAAAERTRIAREMHDVLAHRISLVAMHAGALNYRKDLTPEQMSQALTTIETNAHQALADLREVLGVLRDERADAGAPEPPQPDIRDVPHLIAEAEGLGTRITYADSTVGDVPPVLGRTAYRVVQEALTNARKHAPGTAVRVSVSGASPGGLQIEVRNPRALQPLDHALPRSGLGLLGLRERVALAGGLLRHGTEPDGGYLVSAWLPWPAAEPTQGVSR